jgi:putative FmdB family regulatory protein
MPTYQYRCTACKHEFEELQSMTDEPLQSCPKCGGRVKRLISGGAGVIFKGSGFYATDYRGPKYKKDAALDSSSGSGPGKSDPGSSKTGSSEVKSPAGKG